MLRAQGVRAGVVALAVAGLMTGLPGSVAAHQPGRQLSGQVLVESPTPEVVLCTWLQAGSASQDLVGRVIRLRPDEGDAFHHYELTTDAPVGDLSLAFYRGSATCDDPNELPIAEPGVIPRRAGYAVIGGLAERAVGPCYYTMPPTCAADPVPGALVSYTFSISGGPAA